MADTIPPARRAPTVAREGLVLANRYRLDRPLASGGMAQVWEGTDEVLEREVAVKILHPHLSHDPSLLQRFRSEAVAAARLNHHAIVAIYDTCSEHGLEAIVMELVHGRTLRAWLDEHGPLTPLRTAELGARVADALDTAHAAGLVHRDVKPANLLLCDDGRVLITDFGIAKLRDDTDLTQTGTLLGTAKYLAPEQVEGGPVDGRTDVYALGVVLYETVCGQPPFAGDTQTATALARLTTDPVPPSQLRGDVPPSLERVILRCLARDPNGRWPSAAALRDALDAVASSDDAAVLDALSASGPITTLPPSPQGPPPGTPPGPVTSAAPPGRPPAPPRRPVRWGVPVTVLGVVAVALAVLAALLARTDSGRGALGIETAAEPVPISSIATFDPEGSGEPGEVDAQLAFVLDDDPATTWRTERYNSRDFGGLKRGVGLVITVEQPAQLEDLDVVSPTVGWAAEVYVAAESQGSLEAWGEPVDTQQGIAGDTTFDLDGTDGAVVLLWITDLGDGPPRVSTEIGQVTVTATP